MGPSRSSAASANERLTLAEARALALHAQGLSSPAAFGLGKDGVLRALEQLGYVQLDTISVVERAHHHVLWSRVPDYSPAQLRALQSEGKIFEYWSHAAAYLPMRDFRFSLPRKKAYADGKRHWFRRNHRVRRYVLDRIKAEGPLQARDFESPRKSGSWFEWKPAKVALDQLYHQGTLMIRERTQGFQKVYDLTERVLPEGVDTRCPDPDEYARHLIESVLRAHGFASTREITYLRTGAQRTVRKALNALIKEGRVRPIRIEGLPDGEPYYRLAREAELPAPAREGIRILSPFDNLVIQRRRLSRLFGFDYQIECYLPEKKRRFGYFCLPLLWNGTFAGRLDAKADRERSIVEIRGLHLEIPARSLKRFRAEFSEALKSFAAFNGCERTSLLRPGALK